jgi:topoisomerase-4 subunit A
VLIGEPEDLWLLATDAGYGFTVRLKELHSRNRAGKAVLKLTEGALVLPPCQVPAEQCGTGCTRRADQFGRPSAAVCRRRRAGAAARQGQQAVRYPDQESRLARGDTVAATVLAGGASLVVSSGERQMTLTPAI